MKSSQRRTAWFGGASIVVGAASCGARSDIDFPIDLTVESPDGGGNADTARIGEDAPREAAKGDVAADVCLAAACGPRPPDCSPETHDCDGTCASNLSVDTCGASCVSCPAPAGSIGATCDGTSCAFTCRHGFRACGKGCLEVRTDGKNCGECGHDCLGGACVGGQCQPVVILGDLPYLRFIAVDVSNLYWTTDDGSVMRMPLAGGAVTTMASQQGRTTGIAVDASNVYWTTDVPEGSIVRLPLTGGTPTTLASGLDAPFGIAVDSSNLYFTGYMSGAVAEMPLAGGAATTLTSGPTPSGATGIALSGSDLYWGANNISIERMRLTGSSPSTLATEQNDPMGVAVDQTHIYWTNFYGGAVMRTPLAGGAVTTLVSSLGGTGGYAGGLAVDATSLYWTAATSNDVGSLVRLAK